MSGFDHLVGMYWLDAIAEVEAKNIPYRIAYRNDKDIPWPQDHVTERVNLILDGTINVKEVYYG